MTTTRARSGSGVDAAAGEVEGAVRDGSTGAAVLTRRPYPPVESRARRSSAGNTHTWRGGLLGVLPALALTWCCPVDDDPMSLVEIGILVGCRRPSPHRCHRVR